MQSKTRRQGICPRCGYPRCGWYQGFEPCQRSSAEIEAWGTPPKGCHGCGEAGPMALGEGKGPHAAQWICPSCGQWQGWVAKWRLRLLLKNSISAPHIDT